MSEYVLNPYSTTKTSGTTTSTTTAGSTTPVQNTRGVPVLDILVANGEVAAATYLRSLTPLQAMLTCDTAQRIDPSSRDGLTHALFTAHGVGLPAPGILMSGSEIWPKNAQGYGWRIMANASNSGFWARWSTSTGWTTSAPAHLPTTGGVTAHDWIVSTAKFIDSKGTISALAWPPDKFMQTVDSGGSYAVPIGSSWPDTFPQQFRGASVQAGGGNGDRYVWAVSKDGHLWAAANDRNHGGFDTNTPYSGYAIVTQGTNPKRLLVICKLNYSGRQSVGDFLGDVVDAIGQALEAVLQIACSLVQSGGAQKILNYNDSTGQIVQNTAGALCAMVGGNPPPVPEAPSQFPWLLAGLGAVGLLAFMAMRK